MQSVDSHSVIIQCDSTQNVWWKFRLDNETDNVIIQVKYGQVVETWPLPQQSVSTKTNNNLSQRSNVFLCADAINLEVADLHFNNNILMWIK